jgi:hypothetical protein
MTKTISDEEYERLIKRDAQVDECLEKFSSISGIQAKEFRKTAKPKQYRPTLDELVKVYAEGIGGRQFVSACCRDGLKAVIERVFQGMQDDPRASVTAYHDVMAAHRIGYKEE